MMKMNWSKQVMENFKLSLLTQYTSYDEAQECTNRIVVEVE